MTLESCSLLPANLIHFVLMSSLVKFTINLAFREAVKLSWNVDIFRILKRVVNISVVIVHSQINSIKYNITITLPTLKATKLEQYKSSKH